MRNTLFFSLDLKDIITVSNIKRGKKMAKADYTQLAKEVVAAVGGKRKHCQRDQLYDETALCAEGR